MASSNGSQTSLTYGNFLHRLNHWWILCLYSGRLQIALDKERHTHEMFLSILSLKHFRWCSKSPGQNIPDRMLSIADLVLRTQLLLQSSVLVNTEWKCIIQRPNVHVWTKFPFFHSRWKIQTKIWQMALGRILSGWKQEILKIFVQL